MWLISRKRTMRTEMMSCFNADSHNSKDIQYLRETDYCLVKVEA